MRSGLRLLANVKPARYLEPLAPTGLTGLLTHPSPRSTLIFLYSRTLEKLKTLPESSVYRQSTEALTRHRLQIIESAKPPGFDAWLERVKKVIAENPGQFQKARLPDGTFAGLQRDDSHAGRRAHEWDGIVGPMTEGPNRTPEEIAQWEAIMEEATTPKHESDFDEETINWESEPALEAEQIADIENKIGAGLIEEVIQVAEGELKLVDELAKSQVWEELAEKPRPGQWTYFERDTHTPGKP
ncbi:putative NADH-ubiquinone oxidoreductase 299 kDa subunit [Talaromyces proteolyticus]|uniref:NADH-ubiquinone oxidoreductase 299 kDa subunit n=1 Tax=Talaromyces proteolyticus TaxID=1131652 RepID=A0AAD4KGE4_9EURO|nr:putative NADH-ubiquinone oxidoreductase 299 kDa subunit [Talaromyces proteolyticus]KAH8691301.1 putative NADH-ubiquinone oxidoreductase 299 kDa subunit [Talaromyces proteolyticus]